MSHDADPHPAAHAHVHHAHAQRPLHSGLTHGETMRFITLFLSMIVAVVPTVAPGHHSVSAIFDTTTVVEAEGRITDLSWRNPHVQFQLEGTDEDGSVRVWNVEMTSLTNLRRDGISGQLVNVGDRVRVAGNPGRRDSSLIYLENIMVADGEEVVLEPRGEPRWANEYLGLAGPTGPGDPSAPELGIFRVWSTPRDQGLLLPEDVDPNFDFDLYPLTPAARASVDAFDPVEDNPILNCVSKGMPTIMEQPYPMQFLRQGDDIVLHMEEFDTLRMIHMDPNATGEGEPTSKLGFSTGRWEDNTLVVRTTRSDWPWFDVVGIPQSLDSEMVERFTLSEDGSRLDYSLTVTDPANFTEPVTVSKFWVWYPEMTVEPFHCRI